MQFELGVLVICCLLIRYGFGVDLAFRVAIFRLFWGFHRGGEV